MTPANENLLVQELERDEGKKYVVYLDSKGIPTVGVGHNLRASPIPNGWTYPLSEQQVETLLIADLATKVIGPLNSALPWWNLLDDVRQRVIANMCFNMGLTKLLGFKNTLLAVQMKDWGKAHDEMLDSQWAKDVGVGTLSNPGRALRLANMMLKGVA